MASNGTLTGTKTMTIVIDGIERQATIICEPKGSERLIADMQRRGFSGRMRGVEWTNKRGRTKTTMLYENLKGEWEPV